MTVMVRQYLIMKVNSGKGRRIVEGRSLKAVQRRCPGYLVQLYNKEVGK